MMIDGIGGIPKPSQNQLDKITKQKEEARIESRPEVGTESFAPEDSIELSPAARRQARLANLIQTGQQLPELREDRVKEVQEHLSQGEYDSPEAAQKTAQKIMKFLA